MVWCYLSSRGADDRTSSEGPLRFASLKVHDPLETGAFDRRPARVRAGADGAPETRQKKDQGGQCITIYIPRVYIQGLEPTVGGYCGKIGCTPASWPGWKIGDD